jgi:hypothetical protein
MPYFKVHWVATVGESIVKAETAEEAKKIVEALRVGKLEKELKDFIVVCGPRYLDSIVFEEFWTDAPPSAEDVDEMTPEELRAYGLEQC